MDVEQVLAGLLDRHSIADVKLAREQLMGRADEIRLMNEVSGELDAVTRFVDAVSAEFAAVVGANAINAAAHRVAVAGLLENQRKSAGLLRELMDAGYGKVVTVELPDGGRRQYRIAQANRSAIKDLKGGDLMVVARLAPIAGRLISVVVGDVVELPMVGECEVVAVSLLDRSQQCPKDDFSAIEFDSLDVRNPLVLHHLRAAFAEWLGGWSQFSNAEGALGDADGEVDVASPSVSPEDISLGSRFYTRTTRAQEALIRKLWGGLVIVEGVAGSGKTSVALGRLKSLHDSQFGYIEDGEEKHDAFFATRNQMVGFVRHAQLVEYLKSAIDELNLSGVPVREFKELQNQLILQRASVLQLSLPGTKGGTKKRAVAGATPDPIEGRMVWLRTAAREIQHRYLAEIRARLADAAGWWTEFDEKATYFDAREVGEVEFSKLFAGAWRRAAAEIDNFVASFGTESRQLPLDRFILRLKRTYDAIYDMVEDRSQWYLNRDREWVHLRPAGFSGDAYRPLLGANYAGQVSSQLKRMRDRFREQARRVLHVDSADDGQWLPKLADWYADALDAPASLELAGQGVLDNIRQRVRQNQLANTDINLLLAVAAVMARGHEYRNDDQKRLAASLSEPRFYSAVFIDEVQDFTEIEVFLMTSMADPQRNAVTVVGDFKQQLYGGTVRELAACFPYAQPSELQPAALEENKRQHPALAEFSARLRAAIAAPDTAALPEVQSGAQLEELHLEEPELACRLADIIADIPNTKSIAVIAPNAELAQQLEAAARPYIEAQFRETRFSFDNRDLVKRLYVHFTEPKPTKGLEFDVVIAPYFNRFDLHEPLQAHAAYVTVSRPRERLVLIHA